MGNPSERGIRIPTSETGGHRFTESAEVPGGLSVVFIMAHPGDFEQKGGGTALLLKRAGHTVTSIAMTNGEAVSHDHEPDVIGNIRQKESLMAHEILGVDHRTLALPDAHLTPSLDLRNTLVRTLRSLPRIDIVITHPPGMDYMGDHSNTGSVVQEAVAYAGIPKVEPDTSPIMHKIAFYQTEPENGIDGQGQIARVGMVIDISPVWRGKLEAFRAHESQRTHIQRTIANGLMRGHQVGKQFGEGYTQNGFEIFEQRNLLAEALPGYAYTRS